MTFVKNPLKSYFQVSLVTVVNNFSSAGLVTNIPRIHFQMGSSISRNYESEPTELTFSEVDTSFPRPFDVWDDSVFYDSDGVNAGEPKDNMRGLAVQPANPEASHSYNEDLARKKQENTGNRTSTYRGKSTYQALS